MLSCRTFASKGCGLFAGIVIAWVTGCAAPPAVTHFPPLQGDSGLKWITITVKGME